MTHKQSIQILEERLAKIDAERRLILSELEQLRNGKARAFETPNTPLLGVSVSASIPVTPQEKIALFLHLFGCRRDVYPKRWENLKTSKSGYAPACRNEWKPGICKKPEIKCSDCPNQAFFAFDEQAIDAHLRGLQTIGTYAIRQDDTCIFLACDFDGPHWQKDVVVYRDVAKSLGIDIALNVRVQVKVLMLGFSFVSRYLRAWPECLAPGFWPNAARFAIN